MSRTKYLPLMAFNLSCAAVIITPCPALCDGDQLAQTVVDQVVWSGIWHGVKMLISLACIEMLVVTAEAFTIHWMLRLPMRTAFRWSFLANLTTAFLWPFIVNWTGLVPGYLLIPVSILIAIALEFIVLVMLNRNRTAKGSVLFCCMIANAITLPLIYLAAITVIK